MTKKSNTIGKVPGFVAILTSLLAIALLAGHINNYNTACKNNAIYKNNVELKEALGERDDYITILEDEVERLNDENGIFTSMLGEIESEPGGHEILKKLFDQFHNHEIE